MKKAINCLITGGAGFIGSHLVDALLAKGYKVYCIDNLITGNKDNIKHHLGNLAFHFIQEDIVKINLHKFQQSLPTIHYIYHLASPASPPYYQRYSIETLLVNSYGTYQMLQLANYCKACFLLTSTSEVYGDPLEHPQKEEYYGNVNPIGVRACYDESKRFAETITMEYVRKFKLNAKIIRIFNTYGPRMHPEDGRVIVNFINQAIKGRPVTIYGTGQQTRSFCYISDMVAGLIQTMENRRTKGEVINLGYPKEHTIKEIADIIIQYSKSESKIIFLEKKEDDPTRRRPDITKAGRLIHWLPKVSLSAGLKETISYFINL